MKRIKAIGFMFLAAVIVLLGVQLSLIFSNKQYTEQMQALQQNSEKQKQIFRVFSLLLDIETGTRGYILTGDPVFKLPYEKAVEAMPKELSLLEGRFSTEQFTRLNIVIEKRIFYAKNLIEKKDRNETITTHDLEIGKTQMDAFRNEFKEIEVLGEKILSEQKGSVSSSSKGVESLMIVGFVVSTLIVFACAFLIYFEFQDRLKAQKTLKLALATSEAITNNIGQGVVAADKNGAILFANQISLNVRNMTLEQFQQKTIEELFEKAEVDPTRLKELLSTKKTVEETVVSYSTGVKRTVRLNFSPLIVNDQVEGVVITFFDISKEAESINELTSEKESADIASRAKSEFLAKMSHEIRTPLNAILGVGEILNMTNLTPEQQKCMDIYQRSSQTLINLVNDILDLSKIEAGKIELNPTSFSLKNLVDTCTSIMDFRASQRGLLFKSKVTADHDHFIGDEGRIRQIVINLLGNAIKFTEQGGIHLGVSYVRHDNTQVELLISVRDTGRGIAPENIDSLFSNYQQESNKISSEFGGTGLGLSLSRELARLMGGDISVKSQLGIGSEFTLSCFVTMAKGEFENESSPKGKVQKNLKILLVDDNPENRFIVKRFLDGSEVHIDEVGDGEAAVEQFRHNKYDMIFMDINMPIMDGIDATKGIRHIEKRHNLPRTLVIALSANALAQEYERAMEAGCDDYLTKPLARGKLLATIQKWQDVDIADSEPVDEEIKAAVPGYIENRLRDVVELQKLFAAKDHTGIKKIAHKIAGTAESYGLAQLGKTSSILEQACKDEDWEEIDRCLKKMEQLLKK